MAKKLKNIQDLQNACTGKTVKFIEPYRYDDQEECVIVTFTDGTIVEFSSGSSGARLEFWLAEC